MTALVCSAASALADIGHLFESVESPAQRIVRALELLGRFVPYERCALLEAGAPDAPTIVPAAGAGEREALRGRLQDLLDLVSERAAAREAPLGLQEPRDGLSHLAVPLVALDQVSGVLMVQRREPYEEPDLKLLAVVASQLSGYLANVRLRAEERRSARAARRAADLLDHILDGFLEIDRGWRCVTANPAAGRLLGRGPENLVGADARLELDLGRDRPILRACELSMNDQVSTHLDAVRDGARDRWLECDVYPTAVGASIFLRDVTERRRVEELRRVVLGMVGHDLRTPIGAISFSAQALLKRGGFDESTTRALERIERSGARMGEMVARLLDVTSIQLGSGLALQRDDCDLRQIGQDVVNELSAAHPGRTIEWKASGELHGRWDSGRLMQLLSNLVSNALQHGGGQSPVRIAAHEAGPGRAAIAVHNYGRPIPPELLAAIFEPFRQADPGSGNGGLGLGLFIARSIAQAHGGRISVESSIEAGTTFTVELPRGG